MAAEESDAKNDPLREKDGTPRGRIHYATNRPTRKDPLGIRSLYQSRWTVENQGFRTLTQRFGLDVRVGRKLAAICARIGFVIMLHNAMSVLRHGYPGPWEDEKRRLGDQGGVGPMMGGPQVEALTADGAMGLWTTAEYEGLVEKRQITKLQEAAKAALREGRDAKQVLSDLLGPPPGKKLTALTPGGRERSTPSGFRRLWRPVGELASGSAVVVGSPPPMRVRRPLRS